eukprot:2357380-Rhodomonas_salina.1
MANTTVMMDAPSTTRQRCAFAAAVLQLPLPKWGGHAGSASAARAIAHTSISASQEPHRTTPAPSLKGYVVSGLVCTEVPTSLNVKIECGPSRST